MATVVLDRPMMKYYTRIIHLERPHVLFLCGPSFSAHLITNFREHGISFGFLSKPVDEWELWKDKDNYVGD